MAPIHSPTLGGCMTRFRALLLATSLLFAIAPHRGWTAPLPQREDPQPGAAEIWQAVLTRTAELRALPPQADVPTTVVTRQQQESSVAELLGREGVAADLAVGARLYVLLGLLDPNDDIVRLVGQLRGQEVDGTYNLRSGQVSIVS